MSNTGKTERELKPWTRQLLHFAGLVFLYLNVFVIFERFGSNQWWSLPALITAVLHQGTVALVWRYALFRPIAQNRWLKVKIAFFGLVFFFFLGMRIYVTLQVSRETARTIFPPMEAVVIGLAVIVFFSAWTLYSVLRYFGILRALGADHFIPAYRQKPLVKEGIFRYTGNAMYTYATLIFFLPGLWYYSGPGLAVGAFHYLAVWIHYWATELPDMSYIYGNGAENKDT